MIRLRLGTPVRSAVLPSIVGAALAMLGPPASTARAQWFGAPGFGYGVPVGGFGYGGFGYGFPGAFGTPWYGYGANPYAFSVLHQPNVQAGLAFQSVATGRLAPFSYGGGFGGPFDYGAGPFGYGGAYGYGFGPFGYAGTAFYNPYFAGGLTPLAVQSAQLEQALLRGAEPVRYRITLPAAPPADPAAAGPIK